MTETVPFSRREGLLNVLYGVGFAFWIETHEFLRIECHHVYRDFGDSVVVVVVVVVLSSRRSLMATTTTPGDNGIFGQTMLFGGSVGDRVEERLESESGSFFVG